MKEFLKKKENRNFVIAGGVVLVILIGCLSTVLYQKLTAPEPLEVVSQAEADQAVALTEETPKIFVHVKGAVNNPGLFELDKGSRVQQAIDAAGGATEEADLERVNLARILSDGQELYVVKRGEAVPVGVSSAGVSSSLNGKVNLNTASQSELETLPDVGPSTAQKIIQYRSEQPFTNIRDILKIHGIGSATFEQMKDWIDV